MTLNVQQIESSKNPLDLFTVELSMLSCCIGHACFGRYLVSRFHADFRMDFGTKAREDMVRFVPYRTLDGSKDLS